MLTPSCPPKTPEKLSVEVNPAVFGDQNFIWQTAVAQWLPQRVLDVLDVGTGASNVTKTMTAANKHLQVLTCDVNPRTGPTFQQGIWGKYDVVTAFDVLDYDPKWRHTLDRLRFASYKYVVIKGGNYAHSKNQDPYKVIELTPKELVTIAAQHGLRYVYGWTKAPYGKTPQGSYSKIQFEASNFQVSEYCAVFELVENYPNPFISGVKELLFTPPDAIDAKITKLLEGQPEQGPKIVADYQRYLSTKLPGEL